MHHQLALGSLRTARTVGKTGEPPFWLRRPSFPLLAGSEAIRGNAIIALGNIGDPAGVEALSVTLRSPRPRHRSYSAWSLGKIGGDRARSKLLAALAQEQDANVLSEIKAALNS